MPKPPPGLFITGNDTEVGKTYVTAMIARTCVQAGLRVGVYKPAASGCQREGTTLISDDALALWEAAGKPGPIERVCPQRFEAPLAPHLAARREGKALNAELLREGARAWFGECDLLLVEGAGGLMSPLGDDDYVASLAEDFGYPLIVVAANVLGTINLTLQTLIAAACFGEGLEVAGIVFNNLEPNEDDPSRADNRAELERCSAVPILAEVGWKADSFDQTVDWKELAGPLREDF